MASTGTGGGARHEDKLGNGMKKIILISLACIAVAGLAAPVLWRLHPSRLVVHVSGGAWKSVAVESRNLSSTSTFHPGDAPQISPISHGIYGIAVEYSDGQVLWTQFFHYDAGDRRRIDIYFDGDPKAGSLGIKEVANGITVLFDSKASPSDTSKEKPLTLDWI